MRPSVQNAILPKVLMVSRTYDGDTTPQFASE